MNIVRDISTGKLKLRKKDVAAIAQNAIGHRPPVVDYTTLGYSDELIQRMLEKQQAATGLKQVSFTTNNSAEVTSGGLKKAA